MISDFALLQSLHATEESLPMSCTVYVYFKISPEHGQRLLPALRQMQATLAVDGITASLQRRQDEVAHSGLQTWMEVYQGVADAALFAETLQQALRQCGLDGLLPPRQVECFVALED